MKEQLKKLLLVAGVGATMLAFTACSDDSKDDASGGDTTPAATAAAGSTTEPTKELTVGAVHVGSIQDNGYNQAMDIALKEMAANVPGVKIIQAENIPETADAERVMQNMINQGATLIFPLSFGYLDPALNVAASNPDVVFEHPAGGQLADNLGTFWSDTTAMEYLMGIVAGSTTKTNKLGWVIGFPIPNILTSINAFQLGALSVNPDVTTQVIVNNAWVDPGKEAEAVNALADAGVDVVTMIVDSPQTVVESAQERGIMSIGFHCLCVQDAAGDGWLTGIGFTWGDLFTQFAKDVMAGTWKSENLIVTLDEGYAEIAPYGPKVSAETKAAVDAAKAKIISGELEVFAGPITDNKGNIVIPAGESGDIGKLLGTTDYLIKGVSGNID